MSRYFFRALGALALFALAAPAFAQSVTGCWATIDDVDGEEKSYVRIFESNNKMYGNVVRLLRNGGVCVDCAGEYNGKRFDNERIMGDFTRNGDRWEDGYIIDPKTARRYNAVMNLVEGNSNRLYLRGFIGRIRALGRSQEWRRVPASNCS